MAQQEFGGETPKKEEEVKKEEEAGVDEMVEAIKSYEKNYGGEKKTPEITEEYKGLTDEQVLEKIYSKAKAEVDA